MSAVIVIDDGTNPPVQGSVDLDNAFIGVSIGLSNADDTDVAAWRWELLDKPRGSSAILSSTTGSTSTVTPDIPGSYLVKLTTYADAAAEQIDAVDVELVGVRFERPFAWLVPAAGQTLQLDASRGWADQVEELIRGLREGLLPEEGTYEFFDDFLTGEHSDWWFTTLSAGGTISLGAIDNAIIEDEPSGMGVLEFSVDASGGSEARLYWNDSSLYQVTSFKVHIRTPANTEAGNFWFGVAFGSDWGTTHVRVRPRTSPSDWLIEAVSSAGGLSASDNGGASSPETWFTVEIRIVDRVATLFVDGEQVAQITTVGAVPSDKEELRPLVSLSYTGSGQAQDAYLDYVKVRGDRK